MKALPIPDLILPIISAYGQPAKGVARAITAEGLLLLPAVNFRTQKIITP